MRVSQSVFSRQCTAAVLAVLLIAPGTGAAQQPEQAKPTPETKPPKTEPIGALPIVENLKIFVLAGEGEMNDMERRVMAPVVVEVRDQNDRPVESAEVTFRFPPSGPSAYFAGPKLAQTVRTNMQGQAAATGWTANGQAGPVKVSVTALYANQMGKAAINMMNVTRITEEMLKEQKKEHHWWQSWKWWTVIAAGAAGAGLGIYYGVRDNGTAPPATPTVTISPGGVVIGGR
jgi:hypothetical protein